MSDSKANDLDADSGAYGWGEGSWNWTTTNAIPVSGGQKSMEVVRTNEDDDTHIGMYI